MKKKHLSAALKNSELTIGTWLTLAHPSIAEIMAKSDFDWIAVDLEHSVITIREAEELIRIIDLAGVTPLVRLTSNNTDQIKRVMDAGAHGVIVPMINSAEDAKLAVDAVKYPPMGKRGFGLARAQEYGPGFKKYLEWQEDNTVIIVQIEHITAVKNIDEILSVNGVDGYIVGPYDLSGSMGIAGQFDSTDLHEAMDVVHMAAKKFNKPGGIHIVEPDPKQLEQRVEEGHKFIAYSVDIRMLDCACRDGLNVLKRSD